MDLSVLIVDDDLDISDLIARRIRKESPHFSISVVETGSECLEFLKTNHVDCILSDYQMPGMNGMELLVALRSQGNTTPVIFITAQGNEEIAREAFKNGAHDYFTKETGFAHFARITNSIEQAVRQHGAEMSKQRVEAALLEEKNKLEGILSSIGDAISIQGTDFKVLYQNKAHVELHGVHVGEYCYKAYNNNDNVCNVCQVAQCFEDGKPHTVLKSRNKDKGKEYFEIKASPLRDSSGKIVGGIESVRDVTERMKAEDALKKSEEQFRSFFDLNAVGVSKLDVQTGRMFMVNDCACEITGYSREELLTTHVGNLTHPDEQKEDWEKFTRMLRGETPYYDAEKRYVRKDGRIIWVHVTAAAIRDADGRALSTVGLMQDITERKKSEEAIAEGERFLENMFASIQDEVTVLDLDHNIVRVNPTVERRYARSMPLTGKKCYEAFLGRQEVCKGCPSERALSTGETARAEMPAIGPSGEIFAWVDIHSFPLVDTNTGKIKGVIEHVRDITTRKMMERRDADFYSMVTHDLTSPLMALMGYVDLLKSSAACKNDEDSSELVAQVHKCGRKLERLIGDYLEVSRIESGKFSLEPIPQDITGMLLEAREELQTAVQDKGLKFEFNVSDALPRIPMDKKFMLRAVTNLLRNAVKFTPRGGMISLKAGRAAGKNGGSIVIELSDTGPGILKEELGKVFEKYYRSSKARQSSGTGLGLYIVKTVAEAHGGRVEVRSKVGKGSTFRLVLPVAPKQA